MENYADYGIESYIMLSEGAEVLGVIPAAAGYCTVSVSDHSQNLGDETPGHTKTDKEWIEIALRENEDKAA